MELYSGKVDIEKIYIETEKEEFCFLCGVERKFSCKKNVDSSKLQNSKFIEKKYTCETNESHEIIEYFFCEDEKATKIGEYPFSSEKKKKISKFLINNEYSELEKAKELKNNRLGIASYVYLRRVIENHIKSILNYRINNTLDNNKLLSELKEANESRDKISILKDKTNLLKEYMLGDFIDIKIHILDIINNGIHNETDKYCLENFDKVYPFIKQNLEQSERILEKIELEKNINNIKKVRNDYNEVKDGI